MRHARAISILLFTTIFILSVFVFIRNTTLTPSTESRYSEFDLNEDGNKDLSDTETFRKLKEENDARADFDEDGAVTMADFSLLMNAVQ